MACNTGTTISRDLAMKYRLPVQAGLMFASLLLVCIVRAEELFDTDGYRSNQYRSPQWHRYFTYYLHQQSRGDTRQPFVFYCRSDCWLSWNAARRAHAMGYRQLYWYRDGVDAWEQAGLPLVPAQPAELPAAFLTPTATP